MKSEVLHLSEAELLLRKKLFLWLSKTSMSGTKELHSMSQLFTMYKPVQKGLGQ